MPWFLQLWKGGDGTARGHGRCCRTLKYFNITEDARVDVSKGVINIYKAISWEFLHDYPFLCTAVDFVTFLVHLLLGPQKWVDPYTVRWFLNNWFLYLSKETGYQHLYCSMYDAILCGTFRTRLEEDRKKACTGREMMNFTFCVCKWELCSPYVVFGDALKRKCSLFSSPVMYISRCAVLCFGNIQLLDFCKYSWTKDLAQELARCLSFSVVWQL